jgi:enoyl-CoA hydratase/carnithine racemase
MDLCLTGRRVGAEEAAAMGLVDRVTERADSAALQLAGDLAQLDPSAVARVKQIVASAADRAAALELEASGNRAWAGAVPRR